MRMPAARSTRAAEPVATVKRGPDTPWGNGTDLLRWEQGARLLPAGDHKVYAARVSADAPRTVHCGNPTSPEAFLAPWRVGEFISSANRPAHVLVLAVGEKQIADYGAHPDCVRWVSHV